ncbi:MAG: tetratricopeptide repeat protein [Rhizobiales bacterium]|nr:tetratricopeptide repeat protein [Hyphomicrobiales bacterium]
MAVIARLSLAFVALSLAAGAAPALAVTASELVPDGLPLTLSGSYLAGRSADNSHDLQPAIRYYNGALEADPENPTLLERVLILHLAAGQFDGTDSLAERLTAVDARNPLARLLLASRALKAGAFGDAQTQLSQAVKAPLSVLTTGLLTAWAYQGLGNTDMALKTVDGLNGPPWYGIFKSYHHALIANAAGRTDDAVNAITGAYKTDSTALRVVEAYARILAPAGKRDEAIRALAMFLNAQPNQPVIRQLLADLQAGKTPEPIARSAQVGAAEVLYGLGSAIGADDGAELPSAYLQLAHFLDPNAYLPLLALGDLLQQSDRCEDAIALYGRIPADSILRRFADIQSGLCLEQLDRVDEAAAHIKRVIDADPTDLEAVMALGNIYRAHNRFTEAADAYSRGIDQIKDPAKGDWRIFYYRGVSFERSKRWPEAEKDFRQALANNPQQPQVLNYLGYSWVDRGENLDKALDMIKKAVDLRPNDGYIVDSLGWAYFKLGRFDDAVEQLERAVELKPEDSVINDHLGDALWKVGRKREATFQWNHARDLDPEPAEREKIVKKLENGLAANGRNDG